MSARAYEEKFFTTLIKKRRSGSITSTADQVKEQPQQRQATTCGIIPPSMKEPKIGKAARVEENAGTKKRKRTAAEEIGRSNKAHKNKRLTQDDERRREQATRAGR